MAEWAVHILTLFPEVFPGTLGVSVIERARLKALWSLSVHNIRSAAAPPHYSVDDTPFGGGAGMIMRADVIDNAIKAHNLQDTCIIYPSPSGALLSPNLAHSILQHPKVTFLCGRYEGIDRRVVDAYNMQEISVGDYILAGGEVATMAIVEACVRLIPGALGSLASAEHESFTSNPHLIEHAHYTRPRIWNNLHVPDILHSGHHENISQWRQKDAESRTQKARPDLWEKYKNTEG